MGKGKKMGGPKRKLNHLSELQLIFRRFHGEKLRRAGTEIRYTANAKSMHGWKRKTGVQNAKQNAK